MARTVFLIMMLVISPSGLPAVVNRRRVPRGSGKSYRTTTWSSPASALVAWARVVCLLRAGWEIRGMGRAPYYGMNDVFKLLSADDGREWTVAARFPVCGRRRLRRRGFGQ
ncbi:hypothetical protein GCM10009647_090920 [Streptomyces sanglieri]